MRLRDYREELADITFDLVSEQVTVTAMRANQKTIDELKRCSMEDAFEDLPITLDEDLEDEAIDFDATISYYLDGLLVRSYDFSDVAQMDFESGEIDW